MYADNYMRNIVNFANDIIIMSWSAGIVHSQHFNPLEYDEYINYVSKFGLVPNKELTNKLLNSYASFKTLEFTNIFHFMKCNYVNNVFNRMDVFIRKNAIENYISDKNFNFKLYNEMQMKRIGNKTCHLKFKQLIDSLEQNGFSTNFPILYNDNYILRDGSHRLSYCLYKNILFIPTKMTSNRIGGPYSLEWFKKTQFSEQDIQICIDELEKFEKKLNNSNY